MWWAFYVNEETLLKWFISYEKSSFHITSLSPEDSQALHLGKLSFFSASQTCLTQKLNGGREIHHWSCIHSQTQTDYTHTNMYTFKNQCLQLYSDSIQIFLSHILNSDPEIGHWSCIECRQRLIADKHVIFERKCGFTAIKMRKRMED